MKNRTKTLLLTAALLCALLAGCGGKTEISTTEVLRQDPPAAGSASTSKPSTQDPPLSEPALGLDEEEPPSSEAKPAEDEEAAPSSVSEPTFSVQTPEPPAPDETERTEPADAPTAPTLEDDGKGELQTPENDESGEAVDGPQIGMLTEENAPARAAYAAVLQTLLDTGVLPDGTTDVSGYIGSAEEREIMSRNKFTVYDLDGDGKEELALFYAQATSMAGETGMILKYDPASNAAKLVFENFPAFTFYENGALRVDWSHNQGLAGDFWPYDLYRYQPETDDYTLVASVDAWDEKLDTELYPQEIDVSESGFVYYIYTDLAAQWGELDPVDERAYLAWLDEHIGGAEELRLPLKFLTAENIQSLQIPG